VVANVWWGWCVDDAQVSLGVVLRRGRRASPRSRLASTKNKSGSRWCPCVETELHVSSVAQDESVIQRGYTTRQRGGCVAYDQREEYGTAPINRAPGNRVPFTGGRPTAHEPWASDATQNPLRRPSGVGDVRTRALYEGCEKRNNQARPEKDRENGIRTSLPEGGIAIPTRQKATCVFQSLSGVKGMFTGFRRHPHTWEHRQRNVDHAAGNRESMCTGSAGQIPGATPSFALPTLPEIAFLSGRRETSNRGSTA